MYPVGGLRLGRAKMEMKGKKKKKKNNHQIFYSIKICLEERKKKEKEFFFLSDFVLLFAFFKLASWYKWPHPFSPRMRTILGLKKNSIYEIIYIYSKNNYTIFPHSSLFSYMESNFIQKFFLKVCGIWQNSDMYFFLIFILH